MGVTREGRKGKVEMEGSRENVWFNLKERERERDANNMEFQL